MQLAGYFYDFGHYYGARCIDLLPAETLQPYQTMLAHRMVDRQEANGFCWDYPLYDSHRPDGTGSAPMTLH